MPDETDVLELMPRALHRRRALDFGLVVDLDDVSARQQKQYDGEHTNLLLTLGRNEPSAPKRVPSF